MVVPDKVTSVTKEEAKAKGYAITTRGEVVITDRLITPEVKFDKEQARLLGELQTWMLLLLQTKVILVRIGLIR